MPPGHGVGTSNGLSDRLFSDANMPDKGRAGYLPIKEAASKSTHMSSATAAIPGTSSTQFKWNHRMCEGNELHLAVWNLALGDVRRILDADPGLLASKFYYSTEFNGKPQEGSGQAIHIAASKGSMEMVQELLDRGARLDAMVTRDLKPHYDVLHAATWSEGKGGTPEMVRFLLDQNAPISANADKKWPLHLACSLGSLPVIKMLRQEMKRQNLLEGVEPEKDLDSLQVTPPLQVAIEGGKLSEAELSEAAALTILSLKIFIRFPGLRCVAPFLERLLANDDDETTTFTPQELAKHVSAKELSEVFHMDAEAGVALLEALTGKPECENPGWNPLPARMSFAPQSHLASIVDRLNCDFWMHTLLNEDHTWKFDAKAWKKPEWHAKLDNYSTSCPMVRDVSIEVVFVPNLVNKELFLAMSHSATRETLSMFTSHVVEASIHHVWWHGAAAVDFMRWILGFWALGLLVLERVLDSFGMGDVGARALGISGDFIGARGVTDLFFELVQLGVLMSLGKGRAYINLGNMFDLARCAVSIVLFFDTSSRLVIILSICAAWVRVLDVNFSERLSREIKPVLDIWRTLWPVTIITTVMFLMANHVFYEMGDLELSASDVYFITFKMLIGGELPDSTKSDTFSMVIASFFVLLFTLFQLNVFIAVIGQTYIDETELAVLTIKRCRLELCTVYLLRSSVIPCTVFTRRTAAGLLIPLLFAMTMGLQLVSFYERRSLYGSKTFYVVSQTLLILLAFQRCGEPPMSRSDSDPAPLYMWIARKLENAPQPSQLDRIEESLRKVARALAVDRSVGSSLTAKDVAGLANLGDLWGRDSALRPDRLRL